jgi:excisionase family DNA binding protein
MPDITASRSATPETLPMVPRSTASQLIDVLIAQVADRVAAAITARLATADAPQAPEWLDSREAASYLGLHRDTVRKLAAERAIPAEQDGPGCKLFFRRSALDHWRLCGGRTAHLVGSLTQAA